MIGDRELFEILTLDRPELAAVRAAVKAGDPRRARRELGRHLREREKPVWSVSGREDHPKGARRAWDHADAEKLLRHEFTFGFHGAPSYTATFGQTIDWGANPSAGEFRTHLWNESLNRHGFFSTLAEAYRETGDERFAEGLARMWLHWIANNPRPEDSGNDVEWPYGCYAWQTLSTAIRLERAWPDPLYKCRESPAFTESVLVAIAISFCEQARHLLAWPTRNNWLTEESMGLYTAGMLFPEFKEAEDWRRTAIDRLYGQLTDEVYPDGAEYELAAGYGIWVLRNMVGLVERARMNGLVNELPEDFLARTERMFSYVMAVSMPDGRAPGLNDSNNADVRGLLKTGHGLFPRRTDLLFVASEGARGVAPPTASIGLPWCGHYVMRTGWGPEDLFMLFDAGPYGSAHQHEDKLHFVLFAYGRQLILDPGNFSYDASRWREYVLTTPGHNTVMVDGMGQHRRGQQRTYFWPRPWKGEGPPDNDTVWASSASFDFVRGTYGDGYGKRRGEAPKAAGRPESHDCEVCHAVTHTRRVLFVKPDYWVIVDTLVPTDDGGHEYRALFHFDAEDASVCDASGTVMSANADTANVAVVPLAVESLQVTIAKGQDDPVQGWANEPWRPVPTAVYALSGRGTTWMAFVLYPMRPAETCLPISLERIPVDGDALGLAVTFTDGRRDLMQFGHDEEATTFDGFSTDAEAAAVRLGQDGAAEKAFIARGSFLHRDGEAVATETS